MSGDPLAAWLARLESELRGRLGPDGRPPDSERILEELRAHLEETIGDAVAAGASREEARRRAFDRIGAPAVIARSWGARGRPSGGWRSRLPGGALWEARMLAWARDLRQAARGLRRTPGYAAAFVLTLALGIGANAAIFSAVDGVLLQPLPYRDGERLVYLRHEARHSGLDNALFSVPEIADYRERARGLAGVAEFSALTFTVVGLDEPRRVRAGIVTGNYFEVMGLDASLGRSIGPGDDGGEAAPVAVLTDELWRRLFARDPGVIGRALRMNGRSVEVVGVARPAPPWPEQTDLYVNMVTSPHHLSAAMVDDRLHRMTEVFARLAPGVRMETAREEIETITARLHAEHPEAYDATQGYAVSVTPLRDQLSERARATLLALLGVTGLVLVIACANVANLILARALQRREDLAVRASLGAGPWALRRQLLAESLLPSLAGAGLGSLLAWPATGLLARFLARYSVRAAEIEMDARVLLVSLACGLAASVVFALVPRLPGSDPHANASPGARATAGIAARRTQRLLVVAQVALCFAVLAGAGLLLRTLFNLQRDHGGLQLDDVLSLEVPYAGRSPDERREFYGAILERAAALPGVRSAAWGSRVPLRGEPTGLTAFVAALEYELEARPGEPGAPLPRADFRPVSPEYFSTLGLTLLQGRLFRESDDADAPPVVVINRSLARHLFGERDPIGHRLGWRGSVLRFIGVSTDWRTVVGVVSDSADYGVGRPAPHVVYHPWEQQPSAEALFLRTPTPDATARAVVGIVRGLAPEQPVENVATLAQVHADAIAPQRLNAALVGGFALLALAIASVGVGGVLAFGVSQRRRELGVRAALGADRRRLVWLVLREGGWLALVGLAAGGALSAASSRLVEGLLFGVPPGDPLTLAGVAAALLAVALVASWAPATRAARIDPARALRAD